MTTIQIVSLVILFTLFVLGGGPERFGIAAILFAFFASMILHFFDIRFDFYTINPYHFFISICCFIMSFMLAILANRLWPLVFSALYLVQILGHIASIFAGQRESRAYWAMTQIPTVAQVIVVGVGVLFYMRRKSAGMFFADWRDRLDI